MIRPLFTLSLSLALLPTGTLDSPIIVTEPSEIGGALVFSGTLPGGERVSNSTHCDDWTRDDGGNFGCPHPGASL